MGGKTKTIPAPENGLDHKSRAKTYNINFSELDLTVILEALGHKEARAPSKCNRIVIERIYRAMGVRLG